MPLYDRYQNSCEKRNDLIKFSVRTSHPASQIKHFCNFESNFGSHTHKVAANLINLAYIIECKLREICTTAKSNLFCVTEKTR